jgi:hypothetical protein
MRNQVFLLTILVASFLFSCQKQETTEITPQAEPVKTFKSGVEDPCYEETFTIYGGQTIEVGTLTVSNDEDEIFVTYDLSGTDWYLDETHLYVGSAEGIPTTGSGNPKIGHFPYAESHNMEQVYTYTLSRDNFEDCFAVAAHAVVEQYDANGNKIGEETAWADGGTEFDGKRWGWFLSEYCVEDCVPDFVCDGAYGYRKLTSTCFTDYGLNNFGWTNGTFTNNPPAGYCFPTYLSPCPTSCENNYENVIGLARIKYVDNLNIGIEFSDIVDGYTLKEAYVYIGTEPLPQVNGQYTSDPENFNYKNLNVEDNYWLLEFPKPEEEFYVITYATFEQN